jgi:Gpi18-like mannosyltransferase
MSPPVQLAAVAAMALYLHAICWSMRPPDMGIFLEPWFAHIVHYGQLGAFAHPFSNYEPAYLYLLALLSLAHGLLAPMYLIKLLSVCGSVFLAFAVADLLKASGAEGKQVVLVFILPTAIINAALLGQCDALWVGSCVFAVAAMIRGRTARALVWCGIAFAFKAQAAFIAPFMVGALVGRRAAVWQWAIPPAVFVASLIPAWLLGWPMGLLLMVYPKQAAAVIFPGKLANPWMAGTMFAKETTEQYFVLGYAGALAASAAIAALTAASVRNRQAMLALAVLSAMALPYLLPKMLERYFFLADVLALVLALSLRNRTAIFVAVSIQTASLLSLLTYIYWFYTPFPTLIGAIFSTAALVATCVLARQSGARWPWSSRTTECIVPA